MSGEQTPTSKTMEEAIRCFESGNHDRAAALCREILAARPSEVPANSMLGIIHASRGELDEAETYLLKARNVAPDNPGTCINLAQLFLERGRLDEAREAFRRGYELIGRSHGNMAVYHNSTFEPEKANAGEAYVHRITDALVDTAYWSVMKGDRVYTIETGNRNIANSPFVAGRMSADNKVAAIDPPDPVTEIAEPCILLGGDENYAHWHVRYLMRLALLEDRPDLQNLRLLVNEDLRPYQRESLSLLGYGHESLIPVPREATVRCRELYVPTCLRIDAPRIAFGARWLQRRILEAACPLPAGPSARIYVSRRDAACRFLENEDEVMAALAPLGFASVELGRLSFREQVGMFANAEIVVAPHGAGLANLIYASETCGFVELVSDPIAHMGDFRAIARGLGLNMEVLPCSSYRMIPDAQHNFITAPDTVVAAVAKVAG